MSRFSMLMPILREIKDYYCTKERLVLIALALLVFVNALYVVYQKQAYRMAFNQLYLEQQASYQQHNQYSQLLLEQGTFSAYDHIYQLAQEQYGMQLPSLSQSKVVSVDMSDLKNDPWGGTDKKDQQRA